MLLDVPIDQLAWCRAAVMHPLHAGFRTFGLLLEEAQALIEADHDRLIEADGEAFRVTERGRPFVRAIAACFDSYLGAGEARHSAGV